MKYEQMTFKQKLQGYLCLIAIIVGINIVTTACESKPSSEPEVPSEESKIDTVQVKIETHINCTTMWECELIYTQGCINIFDSTTTCLQG